MYGPIRIPYRSFRHSQTIDGTSCHGDGCSATIRTSTITNTTAHSTRMEATSSSSAGRSRCRMGVEVGMVV